MPTPGFPERFSLSLDPKTAHAMTDQHFAELSKATGAKVLVDILKAGIRTPGGPVSDHYQGSWSYSTKMPGPEVSER
jgi:hypothetical protein